jgi:hypothetical protein
MVDIFDGIEILLLCQGVDPYGENVNPQSATKWGAGRRLRQLLGEAVTRSWSWAYQRIVEAKDVESEQRRHLPWFAIPIGATCMSVTAPDELYPILVSEELAWRYLDELYGDCDSEAFHLAMDRRTRDIQMCDEAFSRKAVGLWLRHLGWESKYAFLPTHEVAPISVSHASSREGTSDKLALLNQASTRFWSNATRDDPSTQPENATVIQWLVERGYTESLAQKAATIVRPEWAVKGRKPDGP